MILLKTIKSYQIHLKSEKNKNIEKSKIKNTLNLVIIIKVSNIWYDSKTKHAKTIIHQIKLQEKNRILSPINIIMKYYFLSS